MLSLIILTRKSAGCGVRQPGLAMHSAQSQVWSDVY
jgi:hypothetical protein